MLSGQTPGKPHISSGRRGLEVEFAVHLSQQRLVDVVRYFFQNHAEISDFVKSLFAQFGFPYESRSGYETCYPTHFYRGASSPAGKDFVSNLVSHSQRDCRSASPLPSVALFKTVRSFAQNGPSSASSCDVHSAGAIS